ncbi:hypothetical protein DERF_014598 [Dermatophagoides farinae]|uniref:Uncharacterized protein n=1 Tax=Dermatophagoides farinae TaxID=6954 RepID=A0A922KX45_DERFA|nr:hypothetical protein DERF_014598 [Dermatophagoides farinae]
MINIWKCGRHHRTVVVIIWTTDIPMKSGPHQLVWKMLYILSLQSNNKTKALLLLSARIQSRYGHRSAMQ